MSAVEGGMGSDLLFSHFLVNLEMWFEFLDPLIKFIKFFGFWFSSFTKWEAKALLFSKIDR